MKKSLKSLLQESCLAIKNNKVDGKHIKCLVHTEIFNDEVIEKDIYECINATGVKTENCNFSSVFSGLLVVTVFYANKEYIIHLESTRNRFKLFNPIKIENIK